MQIRQTLDSASTPPAGAFDIVDITEEEPVQPVQPMDATTAAASCGPSFPALVMEGHFLNPDQQGTSAQVSS